MRNIVLVSHGDAAEGMLSSLKMIAGEQPQVSSVSLRPDGDNVQFEQDLRRQMDSFDGKTLIIADLMGEHLPMLQRNCTWTMIKSILFAGCHCHLYLQL